MRTVVEHIEHVRAQPHHVRERVAFAVAGLVTGLVGIIWLGTSLASGAFAIAGDGFAQATGASPLEVAGKPATGDTSSLAGAVAALPTDGAADTSSPTDITVVSDGTSGTAQTGATPDNGAIIPF